MSLDILGGGEEAPSSDEKISQFMILPLAIVSKVLDFKFSDVIIK